MTDRLLEILETRYPLTAIPSDGMDRLKASGMTFTIRAYRAEGLGHVSVTKAGGFLGLMKMDTLIINPTSLDLLLYSYDGILAMRNDTRIVELYDTSLNECDLSGLDASPICGGPFGKRRTFHRCIPKSTGIREEVPSYETEKRYIIKVFQYIFYHCSGYIKKFCFLHCCCTFMDFGSCSKNKNVTGEICDELFLLCTHRRTRMFVML